MGQVLRLGRIAGEPGQGAVDRLPPPAAQLLQGPRVARLGKAERVARLGKAERVARLGKAERVARLGKAEQRRVIHLQACPIGRGCQRLALGAVLRAHRVLQRTPSSFRHRFGSDQIPSPLRNECRGRCVTVAKKARQAADRRSR